MTLHIHPLKESDRQLWDEFVIGQPDSHLYHLWGWKRVIETAYGHNTHYLAAVEQSATSNGGVTESIKGVLPLVHMQHLIFGNKLVSIPFFDMGGVLAREGDTQQALLEKAIQLAKDLGASSVELRSNTPMPDLSPAASPLRAPGVAIHTATHKVRMTMALPESGELLLKSFKSKLRSQVNRPIKAGLQVKIGGAELFEDFYDVFSQNMRDLGSPVHSAQFIRKTIETFADLARIFIVYKEKTPLACSVTIGFRQALQNPWASALRKYSALSPNMLLYWKMLEYGCDNGYRSFDFGRSTPQEGTYNFKKQWGAAPVQLYWHGIRLNGGSMHEQAAASEKQRFGYAARYWQKLPVSITRIIGPAIRKHISL